MHKINDYIIYKREVCLIKDIIPKYYHNTDYYLLEPLSDNTLIIKIPVNNQDVRELISKDKVLELIKKMPDINIIEGENKKLEEIYKNILTNGNHEDLIRIIKTTYLRNKERIANNKKTTDKDTYYFNLAERYLYQEFSIILNKSYEETKKYVIEMINNLVSK